MLTLTCFWSCYRPTAWSWLSLRSFGRLRVWVSSIVMCGRSDVVCQILKTFVQIQVAARGWLSRCRVYERRFALTWYFHAVGCVSTGLAAAQVCLSTESESARVPWFCSADGVSAVVTYSAVSVVRCCFETSVMRTRFGSWLPSPSRRSGDGTSLGNTTSPTLQQSLSESVADTPLVCESRG